MSGPVQRSALMILLAAVVAAGVAPAAGASPVLLPDRESTYPAEVRNVTHDPWEPRAGQDVHVTVRLADDAALPDNVTLLYCRVEPDYVCGLPFFLAPGDTKRAWQGTIGWDAGFMERGTRHVGYNVTLRYDSAERRVYAPIANHWIPTTYPAESEGNYYFYTIEADSEQDAPGTALAAALLALTVLAAAARGKRHGR